ncbi:MAG: TIGR00730 family Rossman fold protein [Betaproteobacteria bacterium]|nr:TIGR00730 family Rossman fold protein [Betaproteobacteria bacterium]
MKPAFSLCVYCGSRTGASPLFAQAATAVGQWIGAHQGQLVYGGGGNGLMGTVARATKSAGGKVIGVIPHALAEKESANDDCDELHLVDNMHQRKFMMAEHADAFLALPGGIGTFEELFEVWTWRQLGFHNKPIGLLNVDGYYDGLLEFMQNTVDKGFVSDWQMDFVFQSDSIKSLLPMLVESAGLAKSDGFNGI